MENSNRPEVGEYAAWLATLCDVPPQFYNLDARETWQARHDHLTARFGASLDHGHGTTGLPLRYAVGGRGET